MMLLDVISGGDGVTSVTGRGALPSLGNPQYVQSVQPTVRHSNRNRSKGQENCAILLVISQPPSYHGPEPQSPLGSLQGSSTMRDITLASWFARLAPAVCAALWMYPPFALAQSFSGLGTLPGGRASYAGDISNGGEVASGWSHTSCGTCAHAYRWTPSGGMLDLGTFGGPQSFSGKLSTDGTVVIGESNPPTGLRAFRFTLGEGMVSLGALPGSNESKASAISGDGLVIVGESRTAGGQTHACRWTSTSGTQDLGTLLDGTLSFAGGVSVDGRVVVGTSVSATSAQAFRWTDDTGMEELGFLPGGNDSWARDASEDGAIIVGLARTESGSLHAMRWTVAEGMESLGVLPGGSGSDAAAVSANGQIIVGDSTLPVGVRAFLWTRESGMVDLNSYLPTFGIDLNGWTLRSASGISPDGRHITGQGSHNGRDEAWIATLPPVCSADLNNDGDLNSQDFFYFIGAFFGEVVVADFNHDGIITSQDFFDFLAAFFTGC